MTTARIGLLAATLLGLAGLAACGGKTDGTSTSASGEGSGTGSKDPTPSFAPSGVFTNCSFLDSGGSLYSAGSDATLTLAGSGASVILTFTNGDQPTATLHLTATSASSALLAAPGATFPGEWGYCGGGETSGGGIADPGSTEANITLSTALVSVDNGVAFLSLSGPLTDVVGSADCPPDTLSGPLTAQLVCGTAGKVVDAGEAGAVNTTGTNFTPGTYDCDAITSTMADSGTYNATVAGAGTITLSRTASGLSATYSGDPEASGTLDFVPTSYDSANPVPGQTFTVACGIFSATDPVPTNDPTVTEVTAGALTTDGTTLFLTFLGDVPTGGCSPQTSSTVLECTPHQG